jgi:hypothetical protein
MSTLASFKSFLTTGRIGPLHTELTLPEVATLLGRPGSWITQPDDAFPAYWTFGKLEISFETQTPAPFQMRFFQIEYAASLEGDCEVLRGPDGEFLVLGLDGLHGQSKPSDFLRAMQGGPAVTVSFRVIPGSQSVYMTLSNGLVEVLFDAHFESGISGLIPAAGLARKMDAPAKLDSIYAYRKTEYRKTDARETDARETETEESSEVNFRPVIHSLDGAAYLEAIT